MSTQDFDINSLTDIEKERLIAALQASLSESKQGGKSKLIKEIREAKFNEGFYCPECGSKSIVRFGSYNNRQRYKCKDCGKTFSDFTNTPLSRKVSSEVDSFWLSACKQVHSLRKSAEIVGVPTLLCFTGA